MDIFYQVLLVAAALLLIVAAILGASSWRWHHLTLVVCNFLGLVALLVFGALVLNTHQQWATAINLQTKRLEDNTAANHLKEFGGEVTVEGIEGQEPKTITRPSIARIEQQVRQLIMDRGRRWTGKAEGLDARKGSARVTIASAQAPTTPETPPEPPPPTPPEGDPTKGAPPKAAPKPSHGISKGGVVFAFSERDFDKGGRYVGEFKVTKSVVPGRDKSGAEIPGDAPTPQTLDVVELESAAPMSPRQAAQFAQSAGNWVIYETMPLDTHDVLAGMSAADIGKLVPAATVDQYLRDGQPATAEDEAKTPDRVWYLVTVQQTWNVPVPGGKPIRLEQGHTVLLNHKTASELFGRKIVSDPMKAEKKVYVRSLRNYEFLQHDYHRQRLALERSTLDVKRDVADLKKGVADAALRIQKREQEKASLTADLAKVKSDHEATAALAAALAKRHGDLTEQLKAVFESNHRLAAELDALERNILAAAEKKQAAARKPARPSSTAATP